MPARPGFVVRPFFILLLSVNLSFSNMVGNVGMLDIERVVPYAFCFICCFYNVIFPMQQTRRFMPLLLLSLLLFLTFIPGMFGFQESLLSLEYI